jgi:hypothetical protein
VTLAMIPPGEASLAASAAHAGTVTSRVIAVGPDAPAEREGTTPSRAITFPGAAPGEDRLAASTAHERSESSGSPSGPLGSRTASTSGPSRSPITRCSPNALD